MTLTARQLQTLRNMGNEAEEAADAIDAKDARIKRLEEALRHLLTECEAEFMMDGRWVNDGQFVRARTCKRAREALKSGVTIQVEDE